MADKLVQLGAGPYNVRDITSDTVTEYTVPVLNPGFISPATPSVGDTISLNDSNVSARGSIQLEESADNVTYTDVAGADTTSFDTTGKAAATYLRWRVTGLTQGPLYSPAVQLLSSVFDPATVFTGGLPGAYYEVSPTTCFTDTVGGTPAAVGDGVVAIEDLSGNGNHGTLPSRVLQQTVGGKYYLNDARISCGTIDFTSYDKVFTLYAADRSITGFGVAIEFSADAGTTDGSFLLHINTSERLGFASRGTTYRSSAISDTGATLPKGYILCGLGDISGDIAQVRSNGVAGPIETGDQGTGNYGNHVLFMGVRNGNSQIFGGNFYGGLVVGRSTQLATSVIEDLEAHFADLAGVVL